MRVLLDMMASPQLAYPIIHITGSNGKTSTARIATSILAAHGLVAGTFISPHLERVEERLSLNGATATEHDFAEAVRDVAPFADLLEERTGERPTYFELTAAMAFSWLAAHAADVGVIEVGLGGRLDATNAADADVAVVTGVSLEHIGYLGDTVRKIAREKLAITKPGSVLVTGPLAEEAADEAVRHASALNIPLLQMGADFRLLRAEKAVEGWVCDLRGIYDTYEDLYLPLLGRHQTANLAVAVAAVEGLFGRAASAEAVREGVAQARSPGRMEILGHRPMVLVDGAHNEEGFAALAAALSEELPRFDWTVVMGVLEDKNLEAMLVHLEGRVRRFFATAPVSDRALPARKLAEAARARFGLDVEVRESTPVSAAALEAVRTEPPGGAVLVTGSLYVVGEARQALRRVVRSPAGPAVRS